MPFARLNRIKKIYKSVGKTQRRDRKRIVIYSGYTTLLTAFYFCRDWLVVISGFNTPGSFSFYILHSTQLYYYTSEREILQHVSGNPFAYIRPVISLSLSFPLYLCVRFSLSLSLPSGIKFQRVSRVIIPPGERKQVANGPLLSAKRYSN